MKLKEKPKGLKAKYYGIIIIQWFTLQPFARFFFYNFKLGKNTERPPAHSGYMS